MQDGEACGATALHLSTGSPVTVAAKTTIIATGGLTRLYRRNSASFNMGGDGYALALRAGAELLDMEFVQFFPIGHLAPRLIGMDPIMWDPFRYKLGGKLLNAQMEEFEERYMQGSGRDDGKYRLTRDAATYMPSSRRWRPAAASPAGGAYLSFQHVLGSHLAGEFRPGDRPSGRQRHRPDETGRRWWRRRPITTWVVCASTRQMETGVRNLFACGEAVGVAAPTAPTGCRGMPSPRASCSASRLVRRRRGGAAGANARWTPAASAATLDLLARAKPRPGYNPAQAIVDLQALMSDDVGPFRTAAKLERALTTLAHMAADLGADPVSSGGAADALLVDWLDLRNMLPVAQSVALAAQARTESRGAHQREDFPGLDDGWTINQIVRLDGEALHLSQAPVPAAAREAA